MAPRLETTSENIARDIMEGRFPERSEPRMGESARLSAFDRIMADPKLAGARHKLSADEIMTMIRHVWAAEEAGTNPADIVINGVRFTWAEPTISHEQICKMADQPIHASIAYTYRVHGVKLSGVTFKGKTISVYPGMEINAIVTGAA